MSLMKPTILLTQPYSSEGYDAVMECLAFFSDMPTNASTKELLSAFDMRLRAVKTSNGKYIGVVRANGGHLMHEFPEMDNQHSAMSMVFEWLENCFDIKVENFDNVPNNKINTLDNK